jgi:hypothetical protein
MINLEVDEAYAFDYLSVLALKIQSRETQKTYQDCYSFLQNQFPSEMWDKLICSKEYSAICDANRLTFDAVDKAKKGLVSAKEVDFCNYQRYLAKQVFQQTFFSSGLCEKKIGYELYSPEKMNS